MLVCMALKAVYSYTMSVNLYRTKWRHIADDSTLLRHYYENLNAHITGNCYFNYQRVFAVLFGLSFVIYSWDSSVGVGMGYRPDGRCSIPGRGKIFLFSIASRLVLGPTQPPIQWIPGWAVELYLHFPICLHCIMLN
jgi:hypothetical protein